jgi:ABC-type polysaccharide/polyol phosphate transport system ATPase subunit
LALPTLPKGTIEVEHVWKRFLADRRGAYLRYQVQHLASLMRGDTSRHWRWALRDINLSIPPGDSVGLVGLNGSGKTTILKILSRVMYPYAGRLSVVGRVGALIEVRAGIHQELTGRENVFLFGSLIGLPRRAVARVFDEIVAFAEVEDAIDRQVKWYSSGMQMRLGFAVAAFLDPDILLVDEVLAVGDAAFQQRCLDRMRKVLTQGTTLVYVSHDLATVEATCSRGVWINRGLIHQEGPVKEVLAAYRASIEEGYELVAPHSDIARVVDVRVSGKAGEPIRTQETFEARVVLEGLARSRNQTYNIYLGVTEGPSAPIFVMRHDARFTEERFEVRCSVERLPLPQGQYALWLGIYGRGKENELTWHPLTRFEVVGKNLDRTPRGVARLAPVHVEATWQVERANGATVPLGTADNRFTVPATPIEESGVREGS